jgi:hypothetical protein
MRPMRDPELEVHKRSLREVLDPAHLEFHAIIARLSVLLRTYASRNMPAGRRNCRTLMLLGRRTGECISYDDRSRHSWSLRTR